MAWSAPIIHAVGDVLTASDWNISSNDISLLAGTASATIGTSQGTTSTGWVDLSTVGPVVTVTTGANALVLMTTVGNNSAAGSYFGMGVGVSGATTLAAPAGSNFIFEVDAFNGFTQSATVASFFSGLTAGSNTFTAKYSAVNSGTATFQNRTITVIPLP